jgi:hypothetical protein
MTAKCAGCGEYWPCSDSKRRDIRPVLKARHYKQPKQRFHCDSCGASNERDCVHWDYETVDQFYS